MHSIFKYTFDLSGRAIRITFEKTNRNAGVLSLEMWGKYDKNQKLYEEFVNSVKANIEKFPEFLVITVDLKVFGSISMVQNMSLNFTEII